MIISRSASGRAAGGNSRRVHRGRLGRAARAITWPAQVDAESVAWKSDPSLVEDDYYRLANQPR